MIDKNLYEHVLVEPAAQMDRLSIVSGYASGVFAKRNLEEIRNPVSQVISCRIELVVGMVSEDGLNEKHHELFKSLYASYPGQFACSYVLSKPAVHSKVYVWSKNDRPAKAWIGSANYTHTGFEDNRQWNVLAEVDPIWAMSYFEKINGRAVDCRNAKAVSQARVKMYKPDREYEDLSAYECKDLPLVSKNGEVPLRSGLNWGQREGRDHDQAYIPVPSNIAQSNFFPARGEKFTIETDDDQAFICVIAQDKDKAIHTTYDNSELGKYFRDRLSVPRGELVTKKHMDEYGRNYITVSKISADRFYLDFSTA